MALDAKGTWLIEMVSQTLHSAYFYVALSLHLGLQENLGPEYEAFALELLALLQKWRHVYSQPPEPPDPPEETC